MKNSLFLVCVLVGGMTSGLASGRGAAAAWEIYVAPAGDDHADGTLNRPLKTPAAALDKARNLRNAERKRVVIWLGEGCYDLSGGLLLEEQDAGTRDAPVIFAARNGERVIFSGGVDLTRAKWEKEDDPRVLERLAEPAARERLLRMDLRAHKVEDTGKPTRRGFDAVAPEKLPPPSVLYAAGKPMTLARWPNAGTVRMAAVVDRGPVWHSGAPDAWERCLAGGGTFRVDSDRLKHWTKAEEPWVDGVFGYDWSWSYNKVARVDPEARTLTLRYGEAYGLLKEDWLFDGFFVENLIEELDSPGEYWVDRRRGVLYFIPPVDFRPGRTPVVLSVAEVPLVRLRNVSWVSFQGIVFEAGRSHAVEVEGGRDIAFRGCAFRNCGGFGLKVQADGLRVTGCVFRRLGGRGVCLNGGDLRTLASSGSVLEGCDFYLTSQVDKAFHGAVRLEGVGHVVRHCRFRELPHMAIEVQGNDFLIENNEFSRIATLLRDMGAVYINTGLDPQMRGTVIRNNYFHDIGVGGNGKRMCVYPDNGASGVEIVGNVFHRIGSNADDWAVMVHGGAHVRTENNIFVDCAHPYHLGFWWNTFGKDGFAAAMDRWRTLLHPDNPETAAHRRKYPELQRFFQEERACPDTNTFSGNLIVNIEQPLVAKNGRAWDVFGGPERALHRKANRLMQHDPGFADLGNNNLEIRRDAPILQEMPALSGIDFGAMGLPHAPRPDSRKVPIRSETSAPANSAKVGRISTNPERGKPQTRRTEED